LAITNSNSETKRTFAGWGVGVIVGVDVGVDVRVDVGVDVGVGVVVGVNVGVRVGVIVVVDVGTGVGVRATKGVSVGAGVCVGIDSASLHATATKANDTRQITFTRRLTLMIYLLSFSGDHPGNRDRMDGDGLLPSPPLNE